MMIAFITINSGLVPLIEGLCAQVLFGFEIIGGLRIQSIVENAKFNLDPDLEA